MKSFPKPKLGFFLRALLALAYAISAKKDKEWLEAMHFELGFIPSWQERLRVVSSALLLALRWRFASFRKLNRPQIISLASASIAALVVLVVFLPQSPKNQKISIESPQAELRTEPEPASIAVEPLPAPASPVTGNLADTAESDTATVAEAENSQPLSAAPTLTQAERAASPRPGVSAADTGASQETFADTATMAVPNEELNSGQLSLSDNSQLLLKARVATRVTVFKDAAPIYDQTLDPEESFSFEPPAVLESPDFAQLELFQNGQPLALPSEVNRLELSLDPP